MLKQLLSRLEPVHRATTQEEREAVYRFRYRVYVEEFGRELGSPDHERRWVKDADDEAPCTTILYTGTLDNITGTVRLRHWRAGEVPRHDAHELSMDRFPDIEERNTGAQVFLCVQEVLALHLNEPEQEMGLGVARVELEGLAEVIDRPRHLAFIPKAGSELELPIRALGLGSYRR